MGPASIEQVVERLKLLRLNIIPPYTYDHDEEERSFHEYIDYYRSGVNEEIDSLDSYIQALAALLEDRASEAAFVDYLIARRRLIDSIPFCEDSFPDTGSSDYKPAYDKLRAVMLQSNGLGFGSRDLDFLQEYRNLLVALRDYLQLNL